MSLNINFSYNYPQVAREAGFKLRQYKDGPLDWRLLGALDLERMQRDQYFEQVDGVLAHIAEVPLANMLETNILDSGIAKYFMLSQYAVQYLLFCRKFLDETVTDLREAYAASQLEVARLKKIQTEANNEILQLHKKITQMEAIHEVVYPCHMCSKSFVSNEALNIHISRKHQTSAKFGNDGGRMSASTPLGSGNAQQQQQQQQRQEKVDDLHLINTIKLELEIKQLKERLNVAEREIRERSAANSKRQTPRDQQQQQQQPQPVEAPPHRVQQKNVGIQSNLMEVKELDETSSSISSATTNERESRAAAREVQLVQLQDKVREFDEWRESLRTHNEASMADINKKLSELTETLAESVRIQQAAPASTAQATMDKRPSVTNLEQIVMEKVTEIGKASAEKLEQVVYHMELNYKEKLDELEREIKRKNVAPTETTIKAPPKQAKALQRTQTLAEQHSDSDGEGAIASKDVQMQRDRTTIVRVKENVPPVEDDAKKVNKVQVAMKEKKINDETFEIEEFSGPKVIAPQAQKKISNMLVLGSLSTEEDTHNQTFIKAVGAPKHSTFTAQNEKLRAEEVNDSTDVSESLNDESSISSSGSSSVQHQSEIKDMTKLTMVKAIERPKTAKPASNPSRSESPQKVQKSIISKKQAKPQPFTRRDAKKLSQRKLQHLTGIDTTIRTLSSSALKKGHSELHEERSRLKQKYPNFYATRNKLKKLVDKLCSTKLPDSAEIMLKTKEPLQPLERHFDSTQMFRSDSFEVHETKSSTPRGDDHHTEKDAFKQRLENILASPMRRPHHIIAAEKDEGEAKSTLPVPVPVPRKRVMFNTGSVVKENIETNRFAF